MKFMHRKFWIKVTHDLTNLIFMILGVYYLFNAESIGAVIFLLAMIEDNLYKVGH